MVEVRNYMKQTYLKYIASIFPKIVTRMPLKGNINICDLYNTICISVYYRGNFIFSDKTYVLSLFQTRYSTTTSELKQRKSCD